MTPLLLLPLLLVLMANSLSSPLHLRVWSGSDRLAVPNPLSDAFRGLACSAARLYPFNGASDPIQFNGGYLRSSLDVGSEEYTQDTSATPYSLHFDLTQRTNSFPAREGHAYFATYQNSTGGRVEAVVGGKGEASGIPSTQALYTSNGGGEWVHFDPPDHPEWTPVGTIAPRAASHPAWNMSYTQVVDDYFDSSMVGVIYGPTYWDSSEGRYYLDNRIAVVEAQAWTGMGLLSYGPNVPFSNETSAGGRQGVAMAGFNGTTSATRGRLVMMGGMTASTQALHDDVWVSHSLKYSRWTYFGSAAWAPRWGAQAFDGGRGGLFLYGGYTAAAASDEVWSNEVWYGRFGVNPSDPADPPVWYLIAPGYISGAGPRSISGCAVAWWANGHQLYLVMLGSHTDSPDEPTPPPTDPAPAPIPGPAPSPAASAEEEGGPTSDDVWGAGGAPNEPAPSSAVFAALVRYDEGAPNQPFPMSAGVTVVTTTSNYERIAGNPSAMT